MLYFENVKFLKKEASKPSVVDVVYKDVCLNSLFIQQPLLTGTKTTTLFCVCLKNNCV